MRLDRLPGRPRALHAVVIGLSLALTVADASARAAEFAQVMVHTGDCDPQSGACTPIPCAVVQDTSGGRFVSDDAGVAAFYQPGLMGREHYLRVWTLAADGTWQQLNESIQSISEGGMVDLRALPAPADPAVCPSSHLASELLDHGVPTPSEFFRIHVVDAADGRGVPMAELRVPAHPRQVYVTDSNGLIAFYDPSRVDPDLLPAGTTGTCLPVDLRAVGYAPVDDLEAITTQDPAPPVTCAAGEIFVSEGGTATFELTRIDVARRLYRLTGYGIYRDSWLLGVPDCDAPGAGDPCIPIGTPLLDADMVGGDGPRTALHDGKVWWTFGDTFSPTWIGHTGAEFTHNGAIATSAPPAPGGPNPIETGIDLTWVDPGEVKNAVVDAPTDHLNMPSIFTADDATQERLYLTTRADFIGTYHWLNWGVSRLRTGPSSGACPDTACFNWLSGTDVLSPNSQALHPPGKAAFSVPQEGPGDRHVYWVEPAPVRVRATASCTTPGAPRPPPSTSATRHRRLPRSASRPTCVGKP